MDWNANTITNAMGSIQMIHLCVLVMEVARVTILAFAIQNIMETAVIFRIIAMEPVHQIRLPVQVTELALQTTHVYVKKTGKGYYVKLKSMNAMESIMMTHRFV